MDLFYDSKAAPFLFSHNSRADQPENEKNTQIPSSGPALFHDKQFRQFQFSITDKTDFHA